jgi:F0F1-type ATP synthase assembly protein I
MKTRVRSTPAKIIAGQLAVTVVGAFFWLLRGGADAGLGALAGGGISVLLSVYFAIKVFARPDSDPQAMLGTFFKAEALKLVLAVVLFSAAAIFFSHVYVPLITTFIGTLTVYWFALLFTRYDTAGLGR